MRSYVCSACECDYFGVTYPGGGGIKINVMVVMAVICGVIEVVVMLVGFVVNCLVSPEEEARGDLGGGCENAGQHY